MPKNFVAAVLGFAALAVEAQVQTYLPNGAAHYSYAEHSLPSPEYYEMHNGAPMYANGDLYSLG